MLKKEEKNSVEALIIFKVDQVLGNASLLKSLSVKTHCSKINTELLGLKINKTNFKIYFKNTTNLPTIGDKIVETLYLNRVILENKRIRTPPLSPPFKVGVFVVFYRQLEQGHNIARRGWGRKAIFPPFEVNKT